MRCAILGFVGGAACLQTCAALPGQAALLFCAALAVLLLLAVRGPLRAAVAGALLGFCWAALLAQVALAPHLAQDDEGRDVTLIGTIDSLPYRFEQGVRFNFAVEQVAGATMTVPPRVSLAWYAAFRDSVQQVGAVQPGERWQLTVRLQRPHGNVMWIGPPLRRSPQVLASLFLNSANRKRIRKLFIFLNLFIYTEV